MFILQRVLLFFCFRNFWYLNSANIVNRKVLILNGKSTNSKQKNRKPQAQQKIYKKELIILNCYLSKI